MVEIHTSHLESFKVLAYDFAQDTVAISSLDGFHKSPSYKRIVAMGEEAIPIILNHIQDPLLEDRDSKRVVNQNSRWIALALDEITGQNVTGYKESRGDIDKMVERSLTWAENESLIEIRDDDEEYRITHELFDLLRNSALSNPTAKDAMARAFINGGLYQTPEFEVNGHKLILEVVEGSSYEDGLDGTLALRDVTDPASPFELQVELSEGRSPEDSIVSFWTTGTDMLTRKAASEFRRVMKEIFDPQTGLDTAA